MLPIGAPPARVETPLGFIAWEGHTGRSASPDTGQRGEATLVVASLGVRLRGSGGARRSVFPLLMKSTPSGRSAPIARARRVRLGSRAFAGRATLAWPPLLLGASLGLTNFAVHAQTAGATAVALGDVVVTATRTPTRIDQTLAETTVIGRDEIEAATGRTLPELLARQPGLQAWSNGGLGKVSSVSIRGLESRHVLLLVDGVRQGSATLGTPSWDNLPLEAIERIEIVRGPLASLYGSDAVGGVVQIFTRRGGTGLQPDASLTVGSQADRRASVGLRGTAGPIDGSVQIASLRREGVSATNPRAPFGAFNPDPDPFDQDTLSAQVGATLPARWRLQAQAYASRATSAYDDGLGADARSRLVNRSASLQASGPVVAEWTTRLMVARSSDSVDTLASASRFATLGATRTEQSQLIWENTLTTRAGALLLLAERLEQDVSRPGNPYTVPSRTVDALSAGLSGSAGAHHWQAALRRDRNSQFGSPSTGSVAYGYDVTSAVRIAASAGTSFVAPSFNQLYFPGFGNPTLQPEEGRHREASIRWADAGQQVRAAWFQNRIRGYIPSGPLPVNVPRARMDGLSVSWDGSIGPWKLAASAETLEPLNDTVGSANFGRLLQRRAAESARLSADRSVGQGSVGASLQKVGQRFEDAANTTALPGFTRLDLRADWSLQPGWTLGLSLNNLTNRRYETALGYDQPGREAFVTLRWQGR